MPINVTLIGGRHLVEAQRLLEKVQYSRKKNKQGEGVDDMEYPGIKKKKKSCGLSRGLGFRSYLKFLRKVTQLGGVASGEALFCLEFPGIKSKNLQIQGGFKKYVVKSPHSVFFSGIAHYFPYVKIFLLVWSLFINIGS